MKRSLMLTVLALVFIAGLGWRNERRAQQLGVACAALEAQVAAEAAEKGGADKLAARPSARELAPERKVMLAELAARLKEAFLASRLQPAMTADAEMMRRLAEAQAEMLQLDGSELVELARLCGEDAGMPYAARVELAEQIHMRLAKIDPEALLARMRESPELMSSSLSERVAEQAFDTLAEKDPYRALDWMRKITALPVPGSDVKAGYFIAPDILKAIGARDPALAFSVVDEFQVDYFVEPLGLQRLLWDLVSEGGRDARGQAAVLQQLQVFIDGHQLPEEQSRALRSKCLQGFFRMNYSDSTAVLGELSPEDRRTIADNYCPVTDAKDQAQWLDWVAGQLPPEKLEERAAVIVRDWAALNWHAAADWLQQAPDGPLREAGLKAYAGIVNQLPPEDALPLAEAMPPGEAREKTLADLKEKMAAGGK